MSMAQSVMQCSHQWYSQWSEKLRLLVWTISRYKYLTSRGSLLMVRYIFKYINIFVISHKAIFRRKYETKSRHYKHRSLFILLWRIFNLPWKTTVIFIYILVLNSQQKWSNSQNRLYIFIYVCISNCCLELMPTFYFMAEAANILQELQVFIFMQINLYTYLCIYYCKLSYA